MLTKIALLPLLIATLIIASACLGSADNNSTTTRLPSQMQESTPMPMPEPPAPMPMPEPPAPTPMPEPPAPTPMPEPPAPTPMPEPPAPTPMPEITMMAETNTTSTGSVVQQPETTTSPPTVGTRFGDANFGFSVAVIASVGGSRDFIPFLANPSEVENIGFSWNCAEGSTGNISFGCHYEKGQRAIIEVNPTDNYRFDGWDCDALRDSTSDYGDCPFSYSDKTIEIYEDNINDFRQILLHVYITVVE